MDLWFTEKHTDDVNFTIRVKKQLYSKKSYYQEIDVFDTYEFGRVLVLDGFIMLTEKDEFIYHEMVTAVPMAVNPEIKKVLVIGAVRAVAEKYPDLHIVHFDAHADLRDDYLGVKESHACVLHRCWDIVGDGKIYQFGIRSGDRDEFKFAKEHTFMEKFGFFRLDSIVKKLQGKPVYFTLDLDVLDPSEFPGTGTPEAGGVTFKELMFAVEEVAKLNIVGFDVNELSPVYDQTGRSTALACKLLREILLYFYK